MDDGSGVAEFIRYKEGKKAVEPHIRKKMIDENSSLKEYFEAEIVSFKFKPRKRTEDEDSETEDSELSADKVDDKGLVDVERPFVWCGQVEKFLGLLMSWMSKLGLILDKNPLRLQNTRHKRKFSFVLFLGCFIPPTLR